MNFPELKPGDFFCTNFPGAAIGTLINRAQKRQSKDNKSELTHSGFITNQDGTTFEALWRYKHQNVWDAYGDSGTKLLIGRHVRMNPAQFRKAYSEIKSLYEAPSWAKWAKPDEFGYRGGIYPMWRLGMHEIPGLAKISVGPAVCSEITMRMLFMCDCASAWKGWNPDDVADMIVRNRLIRIIYHNNIVSYDHSYFENATEVS